MNDIVGEIYYDDAREGARVDEDYARFCTDLHTIAMQPAGQRVLMYILDKLGTFEPAWHSKNAQLAKATVLRDFGQEILDDLAVASDEAHDMIQRSMRIARKAGLTNAVFKTHKDEEK